MFSSLGKYSKRGYKFLIEFLKIFQALWICTEGLSIFQRGSELFSGLENIYLKDWIFYRACKIIPALGNVYKRTEYFHKGSKIILTTGSIDIVNSTM
jgi:hypothetical protein